ncbi:hypothetical protein BSK20_03480 [SR1 bacterium human oral taxon HOT-345]|nr:hypothetical protein BSK20_03480 [SR1 bacterium human oral taxon HOT-345]
MKERIISLLTEWIENKYERIRCLEYDKSWYQYNYRYGSYKSVSEEALKRANRGIRILQKDVKRLERIAEWLQ